MERVILKNKASNGALLEATFLPEKGLNLISFKKDEIEIIDQNTLPLFEERYAGLGALIGPHFHRRKAEVVPSIKEEQLFPHIARVRAQGGEDPFSHGIGRYAPWKVEATETKLTGTLSGKELWNGISLFALEGQNFQMKFQAEMTQRGFEITYNVVSDADSVVGLHYYFALPQKEGVVTSRIQKVCIVNGERIPIPQEFELDNQHKVKLPLGNGHHYDHTFYPFPNTLEGDILLDAVDYRLRVRYQCQSQENSWQFWHPVGASFVCIEPISAQDPRHPNLSVSGLSIQLEII